MSLDHPINTMNVVKGEAFSLPSWYHSARVPGGQTLNEKLDNMTPS